MKKRIVSSLLAAAVLVSMLIVGISAAEGETLTACGPVGFKDSDRVTYTEAVAVTSGIGLFAGTTDGRFQPLSNVTRAQMATIVVKMLKGSDFNADSYKGEANPFPDTAAFEGGWAEGYINVCAQLGIVKGYGDGTFQPGNPVTAAEALTMLLNALKVDAGAGEWPATVMAKADQLKLADGLLSKPEADKVLNREQLAVLVNAGIRYKPEGGEALLSSVFGVKNISTEHKYGETHCEVCRTVKPGLLTRADLEAAVVETAWAYFMKGVKLQYCSQVLDKVGKFYDGHYRTNEDAAPEYGTTDNTLYAVCSDYTNKAWLESVGHRLLLGDGPEDSFTDEMWLYCENQPDDFYKSGVRDPITEGNVDFCLMRWKSLKHDVNTSWDYSTNLAESPYFANFGDYKLTFANGYYPTTEEEQAIQTAAVKEFLMDWEKNLRPGDVFCSSGHAMLYVGNGYILDCSSFSALGGGKYDLDKGVDKIEPNGSVARLSTMEWLTDVYLNDKNYEWFVVFRPTRALAVDDGDGILGNDLLVDQDYTIPAKTQTRLAYPGMEIDRTASIMPYNSAVAGEELTYSVKVTNKSNNELYLQYHNYGSGVFEPVDYKALPVTETVPAGTEFVSATGDYKLEGGKLSWTVDVPAGQTVEVTYTVKVTAPVGGKIVNNGGFVGAIPSNSLEHIVGGKKLAADKQAVLLDIASTDPAQWREKYNVSALTSELDFAERLYQKMGIDLQLPTMTELVTNLFPWKTSPWLSNFARLSNKGTIDTYMVNKEPAAEYQKYRGMLVENYWGGYQFFTGSEDKGTIINELRAEYLEPGDIITYVTFTVKGEPLTYYVLVYAGMDANGEPVLLSVDSVGKKFEVFKGQAARDRIWNAFVPKIDLFFVLRPSQTMEDVNAVAFDASKEPVYGEEPNITRPTELGTTSLPEATVKALQSLTYKDVFGNKIKYLYNLYEKIGIGGMDMVMLSSSGKALASSTAGSSVVFKNVEGGTGVDRVYELRDEPINNFGRMQVGNFYGGSWMPAGGAIPTLDDLKPGDVLMLGGRALNSKNAEVADETYAVYQGDGKFVLGCYYGYTRMTDNGNVKNGCVYGQLDFSGEQPVGKFNFGGSSTAPGNTERTVNDLTQVDEKFGYVKVDSFEELFTRDPVTGLGWKFAFVIRPTQGVYDICDLSYAPEAPAN